MNYQERSFSESHEFPKDGHSTLLSMTAVGNGVAGARPPRGEVASVVGGGILLLLKKDKRLDDAVLLFGDHLKRRLDLIKAEAMRGEGCGVHATDFQQTQQSPHTFLATRAKRGANRFIAHSHSPVNPGCAHTVTIMADLLTPRTQRQIRRRRAVPVAGTSRRRT